MSIVTFLATLSFAMFLAALGPELAARFMVVVIFVAVVVIAIIGADDG